MSVQRLQIRSCKIVGNQYTTSEKGDRMLTLRESKSEICPKADYLQLCIRVRVKEERKKYCTNAGT